MVARLWSTRSPSETAETFLEEGNVHVSQMPDLSDLQEILLRHAFPSFILRHTVVSIMQTNQSPVFCTR